MEKSNILEELEKYINEKKWQEAIDYAKLFNLKDPLIKIYDKMISIYGETPTWAGQDMEEIGLLKKACQYYKSVGNTESIGRIKSIISGTKQELKKHAQIINYYAKKENKNQRKINSKLIYFLKEGDKKTIEEIMEFIPEEVFLRDLEEFVYQNN